MGFGTLSKPLSQTREDFLLEPEQKGSQKGKKGQKGQKGAGKHNTGEERAIMFSFLSTDWGHDGPRPEWMPFENGPVCPVSAY